MTFFAAILLSVAVCMVHAAIKQRWDLVRGGAPIAGVALLLMLIFGLA
jgi:hypothetical protein